MFAGQLSHDTKSAGKKRERAATTAISRIEPKKLRDETAEDNLSTPSAIAQQLEYEESQGALTTDNNSPPKMSQAKASTILPNVSNNETPLSKLLKESKASAISSLTTNEKDDEEERKVDEKVYLVTALRTSSKWWSNYKKFDPLHHPEKKYYAFCTVPGCATPEVSIKNGTGGLARHLERRHRLTYEELISNSSPCYSAPRNSGSHLIHPNSKRRRSSGTNIPGKTWSVFVSGENHG
mmetsp:Transcript_19334/g.23768  ORF Transcript_19334/g.23768 Transcript_19334/m.23768 type:complete len:238 (-) Transcript_19334:1322-2035(-)